MISKIKRELVVALWKVIPRYIQITINHKTFKMPLQRDLDHKIMGVHREQWMDELIRLIFKHRQGDFIDIGAHAGQTLLKFKSIMPESPYIGFEPNATCLGYVQHLINQNRFQNCQIFPVGLGDHDDIVTLYCHNMSDPKATMVENFRGRDRSLLQQTVMVKHADPFLAGLKLHDVALIKIDVEGYEAAVLSGLRQTLRQQRPFVICEVLRTHDPDYPSYTFRVASRQTCEAVLHEADYAIWAVRDGNVIEPCGHIADTCTDYVFVPIESEQVLQSQS